MGHVAVLIALSWLPGGCQGSGGETATSGEGAQATMREETDSAEPGDSARSGTPALIEFNREVRDEDLDWLRENGFQVDTIMGPRMVRGRLVDVAGGEVIARDPRVASIDPLMR